MKWDSSLKEIALNMYWYWRFESALWRPK